jgi:hypothetical protein
MVFLGISFALAHWLPEDGHKMHFPQLPDSLGWDVNATQPMILADDFMCTETGFIKDIHFWGSWKDEVAGQVLQFVLSFHADIPAGDTIPYSRPGTTLWEHEISDFLIQPYDPPTMEGWYDPATGDTIPNSIGSYFQYNVFLPESLWFPQDSGTIYWLNISAIVQDPTATTWGWKSTNDHWNDDAVWATWGNLIWIEMYEPGIGGGYQYIPGDVNDNGSVDTSDYNYLMEYFAGGPPPVYYIPGTTPPFYAAADADGNCSVQAQDATYLYEYLHNGGPPPAYCPNYPPAEPPVSLDLAFVITNGPPDEDIPTLNEWGMLILALLLLTAGTIAVIRKRRTVPVEN